MKSSPPLPPRPGGRHGFTLAEVTLAVGIAGIGLLSLLGLMPSLLKSQQMSGLNSLLPQLTSQVMARLSSDDYPTSFPHQVTLYYSETGEPTTANATGAATPVYGVTATLTEIPAANQLHLGVQCCLVRLEIHLVQSPDAPPRLVHATLPSP